MSIFLVSQFQPLTTRIHSIPRYFSYFILLIGKIMSKFILIHKTGPKRPRNKSVPINSQWSDLPKASQKSVFFMGFHTCLRHQSAKPGMGGAHQTSAYPSMIPSCIVNSSERIKRSIENNSGVSCHANAESTHGNGK